jgi:hypothetical protein
MRSILTAVLVFAALGCGSSKPPAEPSDDEPQPKRVAINAEFTLRRGEMASVDGGNLLVTFLAVIEDSRCAADVVCVWQGDAAMTFRIERPHAAAPVIGIDTLHTALQPKAATRAGFRVEVRGLQPYPYSSDEPGSRDYRVSLAVTRAAD